MILYALNLYQSEMSFAGTVQVWSTNGVEGVYRFLGRAWRLFEGGTDPDTKPSPDQLRAVHSTIKRVRPLLVRSTKLFAAAAAAAARLCARLHMALTPFNRISDDNGRFGEGTQ